MPVVSSFDHSEHYKIAGSTLAYGNDKYFQLSDELKLNMIVDLAVPWYIHFYASWYDIISTSDYEHITWARYEDMHTRETEFIKDKLKFSGLDIPSNLIEQGVSRSISSKKKSRFNKGEIGRGSQLTNAMKDKIIGYTRFYPWINFSPIGIEN